MQPTFLYGTAWKEDATERAAYAMHSRPAFARSTPRINASTTSKRASGRAIAESGVARDELWLQTKFTYVDGQDQRLPYDPNAPIATQVAQSFASSCEHLGDGLTSTASCCTVPRSATVSARTITKRGARWKRSSTRARSASSASATSTARQVSELASFARIKPAFVQNRCYARTQWDAAVRDVCARPRHRLSRLLAAHRESQRACRARTDRNASRRTRAQIVFRFAQQIGMLPLTGTTDPAHMREDLAMDFELSREELGHIEQLARSSSCRRA